MADAVPIGIIASLGVIIALVIILTLTQLQMPAPVCSPGTYSVGNNSCCPVGTSIDDKGNCVSPAPYSVPVCSPGTYSVGNNLCCPVGTTFDGTNQCLSPAPAPAPTTVTPETLAPAPAPTPSPAPVPAQIVNTAQAASPPSVADEITNIVQTSIPLVIIDLIQHGTESMLVKAIKFFYNVVKSSAKIGAKLVRSLVKVLTDKSTIASLRLVFNKLSIIERGTLGLRWLKETYKLNIDAAAQLLREASAKGALTVAGNALGKAAMKTAQGVKAGFEMGLGVATDPLMVSAMVGMALDYYNVGNFSELQQTSDLLQQKFTNDAKTQALQIDCHSWPLGPTCPPAPASSPASPGPAPPDPPPMQGRYPNFMGPLDLISEDSLFSIILDKIHKLFTDPTISDGPLAQVVSDLQALPQTSTITSVAQNLNNLQQSLDWLAPGATIDLNTSLTYWSNATSQGVLTTAISQLTGQAGTYSSILRLQIINGIQKTMGDYLNILTTTGTDPGSVWITSQIELSSGNVPDSIISQLIEEETNLWCVNNGGILINPGSGYAANTCTWASQADCHGAFPWVAGEATTTTTNLLCMSSTPAPCPIPAPTPGCIPDGAYSPASGSDCCSQADIDANGMCQSVQCPPPVPVQLQAPCPAITDPNGADLTYTEWRNKDWFSAPGRSWAPLIDSYQIPPAGACIQADPGLHETCDEVTRTGVGITKSATNTYDRVHGVCVNSAEYCDAKGVSYGDVTLSDMGVDDIRATDLGAYNAKSSIIHWLTDGAVAHQNTGPALKSCYIDPGESVLQDLFGDTLTRWLFSGLFWTDLPSSLNKLDNLIQTIPSHGQYISHVPPSDGGAIANPFIDAANAIESGVLNGFAALAGSATQAAIAGVNVINSIPNVMNPNSQVSKDVGQGLLGILSGQTGGYAACPPGSYAVNGGAACCPNGTFYNGGTTCLLDNPASTTTGIGAHSEGNCLAASGSATNYGAQWFNNKCIPNEQCPPCPLGQKPKGPLVRTHCECDPINTSGGANQFGVPLCIANQGMSLDGFSCVPVTDATLNQINPACPFYVQDSTGQYNFCRSMCPSGSVAGSGLLTGHCLTPDGNFFKGPLVNQFSYPG
jgi:hypothetical protein